MGPDRSVGRCPRSGALGRGAGAGRSEFGHVVDRHDDPQVEGLLRWRGDDRDRRTSAQKAGYLFDRADGRGESDALSRFRQQSIQPFKRQGEVRAALAGGHRVDLVDDDRLNAQQSFAGRAGEHQVERFGGGDQDVRRELGQQPTILRGGVTRAHPDRYLVGDSAEALCGLGDAHQWCAEVAFHVHPEGLER